MITLENQKFRSNSDYPSIYLSDTKFVAKKDFTYFFQGPGLHLDNHLLCEQCFVYIAIPQHL